MEIKTIKRKIVVEIDEEELNEMVGSIKAVLDWIGSRSLSANGTTIIALEKNLRKTLNRFLILLDYIRK